MKKLFGIIIAVVLMLSLLPAAVSANGDILVSSDNYMWTDNISGGSINITENVYYISGDDMKWEYVVNNIDYDPSENVTNGLSGFQIVFDNPIPELFDQESPVIGGPWEQNSYSGVINGAEWDAPLPGDGIMPGETGVFSFHTYPRQDIMQTDNQSWAHTWSPIDGTSFQDFIFNGNHSVPGALYIDVDKILIDAWDEDGGDNIVDIGENWDFSLNITVTNTGPVPVDNVIVKDNLGGDLELLSANATIGSLVTWTTGKTEKVHLTWDGIGTLNPGESATLMLLVSTDTNTGTGNGKKAGHQEFTSDGEYCLNSGATVKGTTIIDSMVVEVSDTSEPICGIVGEEPPFPAPAIPD